MDDDLAPTLTLSGVASILTPHLAALPIFGAYSL